MKRLLLLSLLVSLAELAAPALAQDPPSLAARVTEAVQRDGNGHSPSDDDIAAIANINPRPTTSEVAAAVPMLLNALKSSDDPLRTYALTALAGLQVQLVVTEGVAPDPDAPHAFKPEVGALLIPVIPEVLPQLIGDSRADRILAAKVLGGFTPDPPAPLIPALVVYLKRDDAVSPVGIAVVDDLLQLGPVSADTATAIAKYLKRSDQTADGRANLVEAIASHTNQSQITNKAVLDYLASDDSSLRARVILSLPQLDLAPDVFADTKYRVQTMAGNSGENLQVINAAKAVAPCWTATKMTSGCPVYQ